MPFEIWQRDDLDDVLRIPELVACGFRNDKAIAAQFGVGQDNRQGRYLIQAADIIGLIGRPKPGRIKVTGRGKTLMGATLRQRPDLIRQIVVDTPAARETLKILGRTPMTALQVQAYFHKYALAGGKDGKPYSVATLKRRVAPFLNTLVSVGIVKRTNSIYRRTRLGTSMLAVKPKIVQKAGSGKAASHGRGVDPARRRSIELAAAEFAEMHYRRQGYPIKARYADNCGYDIEVYDPLVSDPICVEIKGTAVARSFIVFLTPNEYKAMRGKPESYRICVVMDALRSPDLHEFFYEMSTKSWIDADTSQRLVIREMMGARLTV